MVSSLMVGQTVLILGAGPAGTVAAALLARAGVDVTLVEQHRFPRDKVCGECLSALGIEVLRRAGAAHRVTALKPIVLRRAVIHAPGGERLETPLPREMWGVSRNQLDLALLERAREVGATILQPARCEQLRPGPVCDARIRDLTNNIVSLARADYVLIADGKGALLGPKPKATQELGVKAHFSLALDTCNRRKARDAIELFGVDGHYGGLAPVEGGLWNISFSVPISRFQLHQGDFDSLFSSLMYENAALARRMRGSRRVSPWLASPLPRFGVRDDWPEGIIPIGNAAAAIDPIGGEGMGLAMRSAELAAEALLRAMQTGEPLDRSTLLSQYRALWRRRSLACRLAALAISRPRLSTWALSGMAAGEPVTRLALRWLGK